MKIGKGQNGAGPAGVVHEENAASQRRNGQGNMC